MAAGDDARTPYTAGTAPDFYLDAEIARLDGTATVLIARSRASIVGTIPVQVTNPQATVTLAATSFAVVGLPTVTVSNPAAAPLATVAVGTQVMPTTFVVPPATIAVGTLAPLPTVSVATLAFPNLTIGAGTVSVATLAGLPTVSVAGGSVNTLTSGTVVIAPYSPPTAVVRAESWRTMSRPSAVSQSLFSVYNGSASRTLGLYSLTAQVDFGALGMPSVANVMLRAYRVTAAPTLGVDITARKYTTDSAASSDASVTVRTDAGSDTTIAASVLQASIIGPNGSAPFAQTFPQKLWTLAGADPQPDLYLVNPADFTPLNLPHPFRPGEGFVVRVEGVATTTQIPSTTNYTFEALWTESKL